MSEYKRLTKHHVYFDKTNGYEALGHGMIEQRPFFELIRKLCEYEDIGSPERFAELKLELESWKRSDASKEQYIAEIYSRAREAERKVKELEEEFAELMKAKAEGSLVKLPCKVKELENMLAEYEEPRGDSRETYTSGYVNGFINGRAELLRHILQKTDGTVHEAEQALKIGGATNG